MASTSNHQRVARRLTLAGALLLLAAAALVSAEYQQQQQQQQLEYAGAGDHQPSGAKAKKIQIVYIKVPLAKLRPSLDNSSSYHKDSATPASLNGSQQASQAAEQQLQLASLDESSSGADDSQQQRLATAASSGQSSFLIPMAVVHAPEPGERHQQPVAASSDSSALMSASEPARDQSRALRSPAQSMLRLVGADSASPLPQPHAGFMSSFLWAEREKMLGQAQQVAGSSGALTAAASNPQPANQQATHSPPQMSPAAASVSAPMRFSHMPDNMIGQAYNAAVGRALPIESGSPAGLLGSSSTNSDSHQYQGKRAVAPPGGNDGTHGDSGISPGLGSGGSYGGAGPNQHETISSGSAFQPSGSGYVGSGPSSGFGSGISTFGASAAFSDYPPAPSIGSAPANQQPSVYAAQSAPQQQQASGNSGQSATKGAGLQQPYQQQVATGEANGKLRQAKKTIIPIVVQVEHAILENSGNALANAYRQQQQSARPSTGNKYSGGRGRGGKRGRQGKSPHEQQYRQQHGNNQAPYGAATNQNFNLDMGASAGQYINAANAHDINQITAAINAENAAAAAAALAQADAAFGPGAGAYQGNPHPQQHHNQQQRPQSQYAAGLQSAASALLANTHPMIQAAASGGLASVSKLGAKLGEMIALPSMQVPNTISHLSGALPSALSSLTNQMGAQLGQAVHQAAKEHPTASAFARQVAQHAGIQLPNFVGGHQQAANGQHQHQQQQVAAAASQQHAAQMLPPQQAQNQLQNLKLSIGHNLQSAAAQLMGVKSAANLQQQQQQVASAASLLSNPMALQSALIKQLASYGGGLSAIASPQIGSAPNTIMSLMAQATGANQDQIQQASSIISSIAAAAQQQQQPAQQQQSAGDNAPSAGAEFTGADAGTKTSGSKSSLKSKFLSFFQPPKFISNLLSWGERADERADEGQATAAKSESSANKTAAVGAELAAKAAPVSLSANSTTSAAPSATTTTSGTSTSAAPPQTTVSNSPTSTKATGAAAAKP